MNEVDSNRRFFCVDESEEDDDEEQSSVSSNVSYPGMEPSSDDSDKMSIGAGESNRMGAQDEMKLYSAVESARVDRWRFLVIGSILVAGAAVSCLTYLTLSAGQTNDAYDAVSKTIIFQNFSYFFSSRPYQILTLSSHSILRLPSSSFSLNFFRIR